MGNKTQNFFITGTDTGIGKTWVACQMLRFCNRLGLRTVGLKPLASGSIVTTEGLRNQDALDLQRASSVKLPYDIINPFCYEPPVSPHLAASEVGEYLSAEKIIEGCQQGLQTETDILIVEGAGGLHIPLHDTQTLADFIQLLNFGVIVVVGIKLGCLNHSILTCESLKNRGIKTIGWIANCLDPDTLMVDEQIKTLKDYLPIPWLATVGLNSSSSASFSFLADNYHSAIDHHNLSLVD